MPDRGVIKPQQLMKKIMSVQGWATKLKLSQSTEEVVVQIATYGMSSNSCICIQTCKAVLTGENSSNYLLVEQPFSFTGFEYETFIQWSNALEEVSEEVAEPALKDETISSMMVTFSSGSKLSFDMQDTSGDLFKSELRHLVISLLKSYASLPDVSIESWTNLVGELDSSFPYDWVNPDEEQKKYIEAYEFIRAFEERFGNPVGSSFVISPPSLRETQFSFLARKPNDDD